MNVAINPNVRELPGLLAETVPHATEIGALSDAELTEFVVVLGRAVAILQGSTALAAAAIEERSARELGPVSLAHRSGVRSGAALVQKLTGSSLGDAKKAVRVGTLLELANDAVSREPNAAAEPGPRSIDALVGLGGSWDAPLGVAIHNQWLAAEIADRVRGGLGSPRDGAEPQWRRACLQLISDCWSGDFTPEDASRAAKAMRACLDREWASENADRLYELRSLSRTVRNDGMVKYELIVDPVTDEQVWTLIFRQLAPRLGGPRFITDEERARAAELVSDSRSNEPLLADVFTGFLTAGVTASNGFGGYAPTVNIAITAAELRAAVAASASGQEDRPPGIGWSDGKPHALTGAQVIAAMCDGSVAGVLFDDTGQVLDVTKSARTFSLRQRKAMALRDGGCLMPGCTMPPAACEAHHCDPWSECSANQKTETRDGVLLCRFHHLNLHNHGGRIERRGGEYWLRRRSGEQSRLLPKHGLVTQLRAEERLS